MQSGIHAVIAVAYLVTQRERNVRIIHGIEKGAVIQFQNRENKTNQDKSDEDQGEKKSGRLNARVRIIGGSVL